MSDEYILDTPVVRDFVAGVRATIAASGSPAEACDAIRPFSEPGSAMRFGIQASP